MAVVALGQLRPRQRGRNERAGGHDSKSRCAAVGERRRREIFAVGNPHLNEPRRGGIFS